MVQLILPKALDKKPYRLRCRFKIEPYPYPGRLDREKVNIAERFVADMHKQGWEYESRFGFQMTGPYPRISPIVIRRKPVLSAREMLPEIIQGKRFRDEEQVDLTMPTLDATEWWEYELAGVFSRRAILCEYPDSHEEEKV